MTSLPARSESRSWLWIPFLWLGIGTCNAMETMATMQMEGMHHNWALLFVTGVFDWLPWLPATWLILSLDRRFSFAGPRRVRAWIVHSLALLLIAVTTAGWNALLRVALNPFNDSPRLSFLPLWINNVAGSVLGTVILYALVVLIRRTLAARERQSDLKERLARAELNALRHQIEPHFLFNALNALSGLIRAGRSDAALRMVVALSDFLRRTLSGSSRAEVTLREEMEFAQQYLTIQQLRFPDRLRFDLEVPSDLERALVPNLILQPLVENAVVHGIAKREAGGAIRVAASLEDTSLLLRVVNDAPEAASPPVPGGGVGLANVRERLQALYADASTFAFSKTDDGCVEVSIALPFRSAPSTEAAS